MEEQKKFQIQDEQYVEPYHHYVEFEPFSQAKVLDSGLEYYSYMNETLKTLASRGEDIKSVADVGCGDGKLLREISKEFPNITTIHGYDLSEHSILFARAYTYGTKVECFNASFEEAHVLYDMIFCIETLEHISDQETTKFVSSLVKHLKPGGRLVVSVPSVNLAMSRKHFRHYTAESLTTILSELEVERLLYLNKKNFIRKLLANRIYVLRSKFLNKLLFSMYKHYYLSASPKSGQHVFGVFVKNL